MDGLITLLIFAAIGLLSSANKKKKKKDSQDAQKRAFRQAHEAEQQAKSAAKPAGKIPFSKEEWADYLKEMNAGEPKPAPQKAPAARPVSEKAPAARPAPRAAAPVLPMVRPGDDAPEGTVSTQGETAAEHARCRERVLAEDARIREEHEELRELRRLNREKLRSAVVMSEVLGKPVSLRPRGRR